MPGVHSVLTVISSNFVEETGRRTRFRPGRGEAHRNLPGASGCPTATRESGAPRRCRGATRCAGPECSAVDVATDGNGAGCVGSDRAGCCTVGSTNRRCNTARGAGFCRRRSTGAAAVIDAGGRTARRRHRRRGHGCCRNRHWCCSQLEGKQARQRHLAATQLWTTDKALASATEECGLGFVV
jgi:hypothetical protein